MTGRIAVFVMVLMVGVTGAALFAYGEVDPCRMLAKEKAMIAEKEGSLPRALGWDTEPWFRWTTSQYSTGQCLEQLVESWSDRVRS
jgi:hypothetical protein